MTRNYASSLLVLAALSLAACTDGGSADATAESGDVSEAGSESGSESSSGTSETGTEAGTEDGNECIEGTEDCPCVTGDACDAGLTCLSGVCVEPPVATCGDSLLGQGEECDNGPLNSDAGVCKSDCTLQACGDGALGPGEECDDGNMSSADNCTAMCTLPVCGNGEVEGAEACDDGNQIDTDACPRTCQPATCGDGFLEASSSEACDDGNADAGDGCSATCTLEAFCGDGFQIDGEFCWLSPVTLLAGQGPAGFGIGEFTGDGLEDVAVLNGEDENFALGLGNGAGVLAMKSPESTGDSAPTSIAVGDFDADGLSDVAFAHPTSGTVSIAWGNAISAPPGSLETPEVFTLGALAGATRLATVDLDPSVSAGQVLNELLIGTADGVALMVWTPVPSAGQSVDRSSPTISSLSLGADEWSVAEADFNSDNIGTALAVGRNTGELHRIVYQPSPRALATTGNPAALATSGVPGPTSIAVGKFDANDSDDIVVGAWNPACDYAANPAACSDESVGVALGVQADNEVSNSGGEVSFTTLVSGHAPSTVAVGDLDGDNEPDLVVANRFDDTLSVFAGDGVGGFTHQVDLTVSGHQVVDVAIYDFDGDGRRDIISLETYTNTLSVFLSNP